MSSDKENVSSKRAIIALRRFEAFRLMRQDLERARELKAKNIEKNKRMPPIVKKLCPSAIDPNEDCFAMTLDVRPPITCAKPTTKIATDGMPLCFGTIFINSKDFSEAVAFYKAAFGAEVHFQKKRKWGDNIATEVLLMIGAQTHVILISMCTWPDFTPDAHISLSTDDVGNAVDKALKAGATLSGKLVHVYSKCRVWCKLVKVDDPYSNVWIIHSKELCSSCLQSFVLLV